MNCRFCSNPTRSDATTMCNSCWELHTRMKGDVERAKKVLASMDDQPTLADAVRRYLEHPGCNRHSQATARAKLQWALDSLS